MFQDQKKLTTEGKTGYCVCKKLLKNEKGPCTHLSLSNCALIYNGNDDTKVNNKKSASNFIINTSKYKEEFNKYLCESNTQNKSRTKLSGIKMKTSIKSKMKEAKQNNSFKVHNGDDDGHLHYKTIKNVGEVKLPSNCFMMEDNQIGSKTNQ